MARVDRISPSSADASLSILAADVVIDGEVTTAGELHVDGRIAGDIRAGALAIGESGSVNGHVQADTVTVKGSLVGTISARMVKLDRTARVTGDISYGSIGIEAGAQVDGRFVNVVEAVETPTPHLLVVGSD